MNETKLAGNPLANFTPISQPVTELQSTDTVVGTGQEAQAGANVTVDYTGALVASGVVFESSLDSGRPATFGLNQVIEGWQKGVPGMKVGGTRRLVIPAAQAYGSSSPSSSIPANSDLVFDITLKSVN
ncbi:MAG: putative peptidyl-prolyl cis-trans isomerase [Candidatus Saccharibacteria bacterium]|nr:putative peptidyl-prolyl cis-trans isomerase [Candidatus Saccharibacteria bacterium]